MRCGQSDASTTIDHLDEYLNSAYVKQQYGKTRLWHHATAPCQSGLILPGEIAGNLSWKNIEAMYAAFGEYGRYLIRLLESDAAMGER